jgi:hypothetical protein
MTIEIVLLVAGAILVSALIWQFHRITTRQLSEIQREVSALRDVVSRVFLMQVAHKTENEPSNSDIGVRMMRNLIPASTAPGPATSRAAV